MRVLLQPCSVESLGTHGHVGRTLWPGPACSKGNAASPNPQSLLHEVTWFLSLVRWGGRGEACSESSETHHCQPHAKVLLR